MKATFEFNLPEEQEEYEIMSKSSNMSNLLHDIEQDLFRPHRKHGYSDQRLAALCNDDAVVEAIGILERMYYEFKTANGV